jgi:hypothetical protein
VTRSCQKGRNFGDIIENGPKCIFEVQKVLQPISNEVRKEQKARPFHLGLPYQFYKVGRKILLRVGHPAWAQEPLVVATVMLQANSSSSSITFQNTKL